MSTDPSIHIKFGSLDVRYEGSQDFIENGFLDLCIKLSELNAPLAPDLKLKHESVTNKPVAGTTPQPKHGLEGITMNGLCKKLDVKTDSDLVVAAATMLSIVDSIETFSRKEITEISEKATSYVGKHFKSNSGQSLKTLTKNDRLREPSSGKYSLSPAERVRIEANID